jgi:hypothetical protein
LVCGCTPRQSGTAARARQPAFLIEDRSGCT